MTRRSLEDLLAAEVDSLTRLETSPPNALSYDEQLGLVREIRETVPESGPQLDEFLVRERLRWFAGLQDASNHQAELRALLDKLTEPASHPAVFLRELHTPGGVRVLVSQNGQQRTVALAPEMEETDFEVGDVDLLEQ